MIEEMPDPGPEFRLAHQTHDHLLALYLADISQFPPLTATEETSLANQVHIGDVCAERRLIQSNLRLVVFIARRYINKGLPLLDLIQEGNLGLMRAVREFDPTLGNRFSTYAIPWVKKGILRALLIQVNTIRIPVYMAQMVMRWKRFVRMHPGESDHQVVARGIGMPHASQRLIKQVERAAILGGFNLDTNSTKGLSAYFVDDRPGTNPSHRLEKYETKYLILKTLKRLPRREAEILRYRFGLDDYPLLTLDEIGKILAITRERTRQLQIIALEKMRCEMPLMRLGIE